MTKKIKIISNFSTLVINCTDTSFGFGYRKNNNHANDQLFIKGFDKDLSNNLIVDFKKFISKENLQSLTKISVSVGPANFNASRLIVVLARTISQQINCPLDSFSSFEIMAKRIASKNNLFTNKQSFWIYKKLKRKGFIAGKYKIFNDEEKNSDLSIQEVVSPKVTKELENKELFFQAEFEDEKDLIELLDLTNKNLLNLRANSWEKVIPLYPLSPIN